MNKTPIEWTDVTWNPVRGCTRVSPGCQNCYAERQAIRHAGAGGSYEGLAQITNGHPQWTGKITMVEKALEAPLHWKTPRRVFVNSMSDLYHPDIPRDFLMRIFSVMTATPQHTYQILTKRPEHMVQVMPFVWGICNYGGKPLENVWLGVSVESQQYANERITKLLQTAAAVRFLSVEPQLETVNLCSIDGGGGYYFNCLTDRVPFGHYEYVTGIDWVICGGESGPGARPFNLAWAESLLEQCRAAGVPFFMKQLGAKPRVGDKYIRGTEPGEWVEPWLNLKDRKGGDPSEWPEHLRVREFPSPKAEVVPA